MKYGKFEAGKSGKDADAAMEISGEEAREPSAPAQKGSLEKNLFAYIHDFIYLLAGLLLLLTLCFRVVVVSGPSMYDTLVDGDYLLLLGNLFYQEPRQGDIVVVSKDSFEDGERIIKRVIATEGQTVDIDFAAGIVYVDGVALEEDYTYTPTNLQEGVSFPVVVQENCIFVMGDNRNRSSDSRNPQIGQIDKREIIGKAILLLLPGTDDGNVKADYTRIGAI